MLAEIPFTRNGVCKLMLKIMPSQVVWTRNVSVFLGTIFVRFMFGSIGLSQAAATLTNSYCNPILDTSETLELQFCSGVLSDKVPWNESHSQRTRCWWVPLSLPRFLSFYFVFWRLYSFKDFCIRILRCIHVGAVWRFTKIVDVILGSLLFFSAYSDHWCWCWCELNSSLITGIARHGDAPRRGRKPKRKLEAGAHQTTLVGGGVSGHTLFCQKPDGTVSQEAVAFANNGLQLNKLNDASSEKTPSSAPRDPLSGQASKPTVTTAAPAGEDNGAHQERGQVNPSPGRSRMAWKSMVKSAPIPNVLQVMIIYHVVRLC